MVLLLALMLTVIAAEPKKCGLYEHDHYEKKAINPTRHAGREGQTARESSWQPLRIHIEYMTFDVDSDQEDVLKNQIIQGAVDYYESALLVKRLTSNLVLAGIDECIEVEVPESHQTEGVEADVILYVTAGSGDDSVVGWASYCANDYVTGQPVAGQFHIETTYWDSFSTEDLLSTTIHEIAHVLAFHPSLYSEWRKSNGSTYSSSELYSIGTSRGVTTTTLITPNIRSYARSHFGCSSLDGVELESSGGSGTVGAHWEKRIMYNDFMVADADIQDVAYSDITLALFQDSGWYSPDYDYTTSFQFGKSEGCSFINSKCVVNSVPQFNEFCNDSSEKPACDFQHLSKGTCNLATLSSTIPSQYQYFSSSSLGGTDPYVDYCPIVKAYSDGNCRGIDNEKTSVDSDYGEKACEDCRCIEGTFGQNGEESVHATCHEIECFDSYALVYIGSVKVQCPFTGGSVTVDGYDGYVDCPSSTVLCDPMPCINNCNGIGVCKQGVCNCSDGTVGGDCVDSFDGSSASALIYIGAALAISV